MDEPIVDETEPQPSRAQRRWEGMIRVSKSRTEAGGSATRVQQLVAEPAPDPTRMAPPRVPSADQVRAGGRRWQPEPADWTSTVFGIELPHDADCPLHHDELHHDELHDEELYEDESYADELYADEPGLAVESAVPGAFEGEAPAPAVDEVAEVELPDVLDEEDDEAIGGIVLLPVEGTVPIIDDLSVASAPVVDPADLDLVAVQLEEFAAELSDSMDERYIESPVVVPPRSGWRSPSGPRVPASRRASEPVSPDGIGATLAAARTSAGLSHDQVARMTRIGVARLVEFENDDYSGCGADIFARGRLDSIARAVGVDPEPLLQEFDARYGGVHTVTYSAGGRPQIRLPRNWTLVLLCALAVAGIYPVALLVVAVLG